MIRNRVEQFVITLASKIRCSSGNVLIGRESAGIGAAREIALGENLTMENGVLKATGGVGGAIVSETEPVNPIDGLGWLDSTTGITSTYFAEAEAWVANQ
jgi:hypothetical protein